MTAVPTMLKLRTRQAPVARTTLLALDSNRLNTTAPGFDLLLVIIRLGLGYRLTSEALVLLGHRGLHGVGFGVAVLAVVLLVDLVALIATRRVTEGTGRHRSVALVRLGVIVVGTAVADPSLPMVTAAAAAVGEAGVVRRARGALVAIVSVTAAFALAVARQPAGAERLVEYYAESGIQAPVLTIPTFYLLSAGLIGVAIRRTFDGIDRGRASERRALARKLHDRISNTISGIALLAEASRQAATTNPERAVRIAEEIREAAGAAEREARAIMTNLRLVDRINVRRAVLDALDRATVARSAVIDTDIDPDLELAPEIVDDLVALAEEAARNAVRHGRATVIGVAVSTTGADCRLTVTDNGCGFDVDDGQRPVRPDGGYGIRGMQERVTQHNGSLLIESAPGRGCRLHAALTVST